MPNVNSSELVQNYVEGAGVQLTELKTPIKVSDIIIPVVEVGSKRYKDVVTIGNAVASTAIDATDVTLISGVTGKRIVVMGVSFGIIKDATNDIADGSFYSLNGIINGQTRRLIMIPAMTLTAQSAYFVVTFPQPLILDSGQGMTLDSSAAASVGKLIRTGSVWGYYLESVRP